MILSYWRIETLAETLNSKRATSLSLEQWGSSSHERILQTCYIKLDTSKYSINGTKLQNLNGSPGKFFKKSAVPYPGIRNRFRGKFAPRFSLYRRDVTCDSEENCSEYTCRCRMPLQIDLHLIQCVVPIIAAEQLLQMRQTGLILKTIRGRAIH